MKRRSPTGYILALATVLASLTLAPHSAEACSACFGDPNSEVTRGIAWAIIALGVIVLSVLGCVGGFFVFIAKKAASMPDADETLSTDD